MSLYLLRIKTKVAHLNASKKKQGPVLAQGQSGGIVSMVFNSTFETGSLFVIT
ncbi:hypothetical protein BT93_A2298 [Corymbia citriodora subsp. variegata]|nr:hypothetical protein BT93_A2298 [Corymbia citriodora subsp. variegata]